jgi:hypothetical protein
MIKFDLNDRVSFKKFFRSLTDEFFDGQVTSEKLEYKSTKINNLEDLTNKVKALIKKDLIKKDINDNKLKRYEFFLT